jgi:hypothetical protein
VFHCSRSAQTEHWNKNGTRIWGILSSKSGSRSDWNHEDTGNHARIERRFSLFREVWENSYGIEMKSVPGTVVTGFFEGKGIKEKGKKG